MGFESIAVGVYPEGIEVNRRGRAFRDAHGVAIESLAHPERVKPSGRSLTLSGSNYLNERIRGRRCARPRLLT